jgi:predicted HicB family RNase H-like nuclease
MDNRETIDLELEHEELFQLMTMAHEQDITLNQLVENILREMCDSYEKCGKIE